MATIPTVNLAAATRNIVIEQGSSVELPFAATRNAVPLNMADYTLNMQVRRTYASTEVLVNCTIANGRLVWVNQLGGTFKLVLPPEATSALRFTTEELSTGSIEAVFDIEIQNVIGGVVYKGVKGSFTINREITRV